MERSEESMERYTDKGEARDAEKDILGAAFGRRDDEFRRIDGEVFKEVVRDLRSVLDGGVFKVQLERLCGRLKEAIDNRRKEDFLNVSREIRRINGHKEEDFSSEPFDGACCRFFDDIVSGGSNSCTVNVVPFGNGLTINITLGEKAEGGASVEFELLQAQRL